MNAKRVIVGVMTLASSVSAASASPPATTRAEIMSLGQSVRGYSYHWGHAAWDPSRLEYPGSCQGGCPSCSHQASPGGPEYGADCSGMVAQAWLVAGTSSPLEDKHPYSTANFYNEEEHWFRIDRADLLPGDALVRRNSSGGHVVLYAGSATDGAYKVYECSGCSAGCIESSRSFGSEYVAIRRRGLIDAPPHGQPSQEPDPAGGEPSAQDGAELLEASCSKVRGWASVGGKAVDVVLTLDGPTGSYFAKRHRLTANQTGSCGEQGECGRSFTVKFPKVFKDGRAHTIYAYAVDPSSGQERLMIGAPATVQCDGEPGAGSVALGCDHDECTPGSALSADCGACASTVCMTNPSCCTESGTWTKECADLAGALPGVCAGRCAGGKSSCSHDECSAGATLPSSCSACASGVCAIDAYCCEKDWDWICANEAKRNPFCSCGDST